MEAADAYNISIQSPQSPYMSLLAISHFPLAVILPNAHGQRASVREIHRRQTLSQNKAAEDEATSEHELRKIYTNTTENVGIDYIYMYISQLTFISTQRCRHGFRVQREWKKSSTTENSHEF